MAAKLTSQAPCIHRSNEGNFELGGVGAKSKCEKVQWDVGRHGGAWLDGFFCNDSLFAIKCSPVPTCIEDLQSLCKIEHAELDWLSKEMAFQEFISSDRPTPWLDLNTTGSELYRDEQEADIVSTFTAIAALIRDWCIAEKDLPDSVVNETNCGFDCRFKNCGDFRDHNFLLRNETNFLTSSLSCDGFKNDSLDFSLEKVLKECYRNNFTASGSKQAIHMKAYEEDVYTFERSILRDCPRSTEEAGTGIYVNLPHLNPKVSKGDFAHPVATEEDISDYAGMDLGSIFGKQISAASRFSFGRDGNGVSVDNGEASEITAVSDNHEERGSSFCSSPKKDSVTLDIGKYQGRQVEQVSIQGDGFVPEGLLYTLSYMNLHDLLKMEQVCRFLRNRIETDILLWQRLHVELPMSTSLTDDVLLKLATRSGGQLQCLSLVDCTKVTEAALEEIVLSNPRLVKLALPGCSRISADAVVRIVERRTNQRLSGIAAASLKQLRVRNMDGFTKEHLDKLKNMVGLKKPEQTTTRKPLFYHQKHRSTFNDDSRAIDVEECPMCASIRLVYDCTREKCQQKKGVGTHDCRACSLCIVRCEACGRCITDNDYEETFSLDVLCSYCWHGCAECDRPVGGIHVDHCFRTSESTTACYGTPPETKGSKFSIRG